MLNTIKSIYFPSGLFGWHPQTFLDWCVMSVGVNVPTARVCLPINRFSNSHVMGWACLYLNPYFTQMGSGR